MSYKVKDIPSMIKVFEDAIDMLKTPDCQILTLVSVMMFIKRDFEYKYISKCINLVYKSLGDSLTISDWYFEKTGENFTLFSQNKRNGYYIAWAEKIIKDLEKYQSEYSKKYIKR